MSRVVVIGAGIAGLAVAGLLARIGYRVTVLERNHRIGGRIGVLERDGFRFDTGPSWYFMPEIFDHFFALMGTSSEEQFDLHPLDPAYRVFPEPDAAPVTVPAGATRVADLFEGLEPGAAARLDAYLASAREANEMAVSHFLYNPFTRLRSLASRDVLRITPRLLGLLVGKLDRFAARRFQHPILRQILGYHSLFLGTDPRRAPAMYHLMSMLDLDEGVQYPQGGFWRVMERFEALATAAGAEIVTGAEVTSIQAEPQGRRWRASGVRWRDSNGVEHTEPADVVVSTADLHHTETALLPARLRTYPERWWKRRTNGPGAIIAMLGVRGELPQLLHHSLFFTRDWDANFDAVFGPGQRVPEPASFYVCKPSASDNQVAPAGHECLYILIPVPADVQIGSGGRDGAGSPAVERAVDAAIDRIAQWAEVPDLRSRLVLQQTLGPADFAREYHAWEGGMLGPAHILSQSALFRAQNASRKVDGLFYAGATTAPGIGVPMCLISAELVVKRMHGDHSAGPLSTLPAAARREESG